ncbi:hypothetical protein LCGC14_1634870 [marine sediment metagenome]|uniref:Uncharacterized protein n=1 Tax=marine sediment metagenome TaxID=412755 RepID=A0A0F9I1R2_9ZZZZ
MSEMSISEALGLANKMTQFRNHLNDSEKILIAAGEAEAFLKQSDVNIKKKKEELYALDKSIASSGEIEKEAIQRKDNAAGEADAAVARAKDVSDAKLEAVRADADGAIAEIQSEITIAREKQEESSLEMVVKIQDIEAKRAESQHKLDEVNAELDALQRRISGR